jgi:5-methylcytosine-specific restriction endonuclease McrA
MPNGYTNSRVIREEVPMSEQSMRGPGWKKIAEAIKKRDNYTCVYQWGNCSYDTDLTVDHIIPLAVWKVEYPDEDPNQEWNLATACRSCNGSKKDKPLLRRNWVDPEVFPEGLLR